MSRLFTALSADHLDLTTGYPVNPPFSMSAWIRLNTLGVAHQFVNLGQTGSGNDRYSISHQVADTLAAQEKDATTTSQATTAQTIADTTAFHLVVGRFISHSSRGITLDNNAPATSAIGPRTPLSPIQTIRISGDPSNANRFDGYIEHVAVWDIDLSDAEMLALFTQEPRLVQPSHLIHYWPLTGNQSPEPDYGLRGEPLIVSGSPAFSSISIPPIQWVQEAGLLATILKGVAG